MKKLFLATTAVVALTATSAGAADLQLANPVPAATWRGFYVGATVGTGLFASEFTDFGEVTTPKTITNKGTTFNVGGTVGYNWQVRSAVFGLEADGSWVNFDQTTVGAPGFSSQAKTNWFSTARIRAGWAADNVLFYVTGGVA